MAKSGRHFHLASNYDLVQARQCAREMAREIGFSLSDQARIATAVSEVLRQVIGPDRQGEASFAPLANGARRGLECICTGDFDVTTLNNAASSRLPGGVARLLDEFIMEHGNGQGMAVVMRKWLP
jgi:serine/threonine-protein kinase RsbT